ncbi:MAG: methyltransferase domain-containing protein [Ramlibacter sp.]|nr:methyltransferase domain-containing protein [Ramlibacter sp.]
MDFLEPSAKLAHATSENSRLRNAQKNYSTADSLETRLRFYRSRFRYSLPLRADLEQFADRFSKVLEIGCGTLEPLLPVANRRDSGQLWGLDSSAAMLARARANLPAASLCRADAGHLPFQASSFPLVWARHMLYHVSDPSAVLREAARVLTNEGVFCLTTNGRGNKPELHELHLDLAARVGVPVSPGSDSARFPAEGVAEALRSYFACVVTLDYEGFFAFDDASEFVDYYLSTVYAEELRAAGISNSDLSRLAAEVLATTKSLRLSNSGVVALAASSPDVFSGTRLIERANS